eukprot:9682496-Alexandrium_andersonii.AAC.1
MAQVPAMDAAAHMASRPLLRAVAGEAPAQTWAWRTASAKIAIGQHQVKAMPRMVAVTRRLTQVGQLGVPAW